MKTAVNHFLDEFDYPNLMTLNYDMYNSVQDGPKYVKEVMME